MMSNRLTKALFAMLVVSSFFRAADADDEVATHIAGLKSPTGPEAYEAAQALRRLGPEAAAAVPALIEAFRDHRRVTDMTTPIRPTVSEHAGYALAAIGEPAVDPLIALLKSDESELHDNAIRALSRMKTVASAAIPQVSTRPPDEIVAYVQKRLFDLNPHVRRTAVSWLGHYGSTSRPAVPHLVALLDDDTPLLTGFADVSWKVPLNCDVADALGRIGPAADAALPRLRQMMREEESEDSRIIAAGAIARIDLDDQESLAVLVAALESTEECDVRNATALEELAKLSGVAGKPDRLEAAVNRVRVLTSSDDIWIREDALKALPALIGEGALPELIRALHDEEGSLQWIATHELGELGPSAAPAVDDILPLLDSILERSEAIEALVKIGKPAEVIVPALCDVVRDPGYDGFHFDAIVHALRHFSADDEAIELLQQQTRSEEQSIREKATGILKRLERDSHPGSSK